jgi:hypothetical protein
VYNQCIWDWAIKGRPTYRSCWLANRDIKHNNNKYDNNKQ